MKRTIYLAGGCFWGAEHFLKRIYGVLDTTTGFANGNTENPTYEEVYTDSTGFAETVRVDYDPDLLSLAFLLEMYFKAIDPLSVNRQGEDVGTRYRTGIYYSDPADLATVRYIMDGEAVRLGADPVVEVLPLKNFFPASEYHQDYLDKHPNGYCHLPSALFSLSKGVRCPMRRVRDFLESHGLRYEIHLHPPLFTISEALEYWKDIDATHCKNLFMRNHKGNRHYLISFECHKELDIHSLEHMLHQGKLSFASAERMSRCLGLRPGSVSPFGLINDMDLSGADPRELFENGHRVKLFLDADLRDAERVSFHPCDNTASIVIGHDDFMKFLSLWGGEVEWLEIHPS
ncbi:MAG: peptide-methionine (S)-S-oxide reductase MsrA [Bacteroidales bacterium]|nr:peptide-methionine (S)-S-oxide reductase MsrA [Bacteroidales bacterium]